MAGHRAPPNGGMRNPVAVPLFLPCVCIFFPFLVLGAALWLACI